MLSMLQLPETWPFLQLVVCYLEVFEDCNEHTVSWRGNAVL